MDSLIRTFIVLFLPIIVFAQKLYLAEGDSAFIYQFGQIVVTAEKNSPIEECIIREISSTEIRAGDVRNPQQALENISGIYFSRNTKNEMSFRLRGCDQRRISVFLDGVPISLPFDGTVDISQLVGNNLESIRISKGASPAAFGANTLGGSINIISANPAKKNKL